MTEISIKQDLLPKDNPIFSIEINVSNDEKPKTQVKKEKETDLISKPTNPPLIKQAEINISRVV